MSAKNHALFDRVTLDAIIENILDNLQEPVPTFLMDCEKNIEKGIEKYTKHISCKIQNDSACNISSVSEEHIGNLLDSICESNHIYFQTGMKMGAALLKQLLDL